MKKTKIKVVQKENEEVVVDVLATEIVKISEGIKKIKAGRLNDKAIVLLIHKASGVNSESVRSVLNGMESLEKEFLK
jgi:hypothetical protein